MLYLILDAVLIVERLGDDMSGPYERLWPIPVPLRTGLYESAVTNPVQSVWRLKQYFA